MAKAGARQKPRGYAEQRAHRRVHAIVEPGERDEEAYGKHRARNCVADRRDDGYGSALTWSAAARTSLTAKATARQAAAADIIRLCTAASQNSGARPAAIWRTTSCTTTKAGSTKPKRIGSAQASVARKSRCALQPVLRKMSVASGCVVIAAIRAHRSLDHEHHEHESKHDAGDLRSISQAVAVEPGVVNDDSERTYAEEFYRAKIAQRLHQGERNASGKRWPRERQGNLSEGCYGGPAEPCGSFRPRTPIAQGSSPAR